MRESKKSMTEPALSDKKNVNDALKFLRNITDFKPQLALVLGSGLGEFGTKIDAAATISSSEIPSYPISSVQGHAGKLIFGYLQSDIRHSMPLLVFQGRVHFYEIQSIEKVVFPILLASCLGIKKLVLTNASGGINNNFSPGDIMLIEDIINLTFLQVSSGVLDSDIFNGTRLNYFDSSMKNTLIQCSLDQKIPLRAGCYGWLRGPSYETPAEIQMLKRLSVDAVGMSTVPEIIVAKKLGMRIAALSLISNLAAGISPVKLSHEEVTKTGLMVRDRFSKLMEYFILSLAN